MTTICAVKKGKRLCIAADTLTLFGRRKEVSGKHVYDEGKLIQIGPNSIGMAGHPSWEFILNQYFKDIVNNTIWETTDQIFDLFNTFHRYLKEHYFLNATPSRYIPVECSDFEILMVNPYGIFEIDYARVVRQYRYFSAIGSGEEYALGAIKAVYDLIDDPEDIARMGIEAAAQFDRKTAIPLHIRSINLEGS